MISGTGGVGKTGLAVHWAHRVAGRYPERPVLRGHCADRPPRWTPPTCSNASATRSGASPACRRGSRSARRLYRSLLHDRRMLILLDNAAGAAQVRPLLPGAEAAASW
ncbi:hypothetical protein GCM10020219_074700 [Nonomuraea dietziae]